MTTFPGVAGADCLPTSSSPSQPSARDRRPASQPRSTGSSRSSSSTPTPRPTESLGVIAMGIKHADRIDDGAARTLTATTDLRRLLRRVDPTENVLRQEPRAGPGRRARRHHPVHRLRQERRRPAAVPLRPAQPGGRRAAPQRRRHPRTQPDDAGQLIQPQRHGPGPVIGRRRRDAARLPAVRREPAGRTSAQAAGEARAQPVRDRRSRHSLRAGIPLIAQYGVARAYWIDFAAEHPTQPGRHGPRDRGDGASYHSSGTARDRDRLRQEQLERLGWTFHRIWSHGLVRRRRYLRRQGPHGL